MSIALTIKGTEDTPEVIFNKEKFAFSLKGRSLPENATGFYRPVIDWMKNYVQNPNPSTELNISLSYFNSSSVKYILDLMLLMEELIKSGKQAKVIWWYGADDDLMEIKGREFKSMLSIDFELKTC